MMNTGRRLTEGLNRLGGGWSPDSCGPIEDLLSIWREEVGPAKNLTYQRDEVHFQTALPNSHLRGSEDIHCMALGGESTGLTAKVREFVRSKGSPGRILFFFCFSNAAEMVVRSTVKSDRCVVWSSQQILESWLSGRLIDRCSEMMRDRVPIHMLMPYDITLSAAGSMFYGREAELGKLLHEDAQSFAVVGPGRIGKTSLVKRLKAELDAGGDPEFSTVFDLDFMECADKSPDGLARKIAMLLEPGKRADRMKANELAGFMEYQRHRLACKPTLIFDEVDEVCMSTLFKEQLTVPARHDFARFILVGKSGLLQFTRDNSKALSSRLRIIRLGEIDFESARKLLFEPIRELGLKFEDFDRIFEMVNRQTGRSPHMIQFFGQRLVELAAEEGSRTVSVRHLDELKWDHQTACFFLSPLDDLRERPIARAVALALLKLSVDVITPITIQDVGRLHDLSITHSEAVEIGDILVIQNILLWCGNGGYRIANSALPEYAGKMGYLTRGLEEAKLQAHNSLRMASRSSK